MPTTSIDTFFACSLMVLLVVSAMAYTSKTLYPYTNSMEHANVAERYEIISKYLLLNDGKPSDWGKNPKITPETIGLARSDSDTPYDLDIDKVTRLNSENRYAVSYAQLFKALQMTDVSLNIEIKPVFEVTINLTSSYKESNETTYEFEIFTGKHGTPIQAELKSYTVAENYTESNDAYVSSGRSQMNITLSNEVHGPALMVVFAGSTSCNRIVSFNAYAFSHNSVEPDPKGTFLGLSPLNYSLSVSRFFSETTLSEAHALSFNCSSVLTQTEDNISSATYDIPYFLYPSPIVIIVTGWNATSSFVEWISYPQIPLQIGVDSAVSTVLSDTYAYSYMITINSAFYECMVQLGGPRG